MKTVYIKKAKVTKLTYMKIPWIGSYNDSLNCLLMKLLELKLFVLKDITIRKGIIFSMNSSSLMQH